MKPDFFSLTKVHSIYLKFYKRLYNSLLSGKFWRYSARKRKMLFNRLKRYEKKIDRHSLEWRSLSIPAVSALLIFASRGVKSAELKEFNERLDRAEDEMLPIDNTTVDAYATKGTVVGTISGGAGPSYTLTGTGNDNGLFTIINGDQLVVNDDIWRYGKSSLTVQINDGVGSPIDDVILTVTGLPTPQTGNRIYRETAETFDIRNSIDGKVGDIDNNGDLDVIILQDTSFTIYYGDGTGAFTNRLDILAGYVNSPSSNYNDNFDIGDLDGDGDLDVVVAGPIGVYSVNNYPIFFNQGGGVFNAGTPSPDLNATLRDVKLGDLDNDGDLDIVAIQGFNVEVFHNDGSGYMTLYANPGPSSSTTDIVGLHDIDNDGNLDLLIDASGSLYAFSGIPANGNFSDIGSKLTEYDPGDSEFIDYDQDSDLDIFLADNFVDSIYQNNGSLSFDAVSDPFDGYSRDKRAGDLDGDGDLDIITRYTYGDDRWRIFHNDGAGGFDANFYLPFENNDFYDVILGDFDNDGDLDVFALLAYDYFANRVFLNEENLFMTGITLDNNTISRKAPKGTVVGQFTANDPDGDKITFTFNDDPVNGRDNALFAINNQGQLINQKELKNELNTQVNISVLATDNFGDTLVNNFTIDLLDPELATPTNSFQTLSFVGAPYSNSNQSYGAAIGDIDNDGDPDVVILDQNSSVVWRNDGDQNFILPDTVSYNTPNDIEIVDFDQNGEFDLLVTSNNIDIFYQNSGSFINSQYVHYSNADQVAGIDFDRDGDLDVQFLESYNVDLKYNQYPNSYFSYGPGFSKDLSSPNAVMDHADFDKDGDLDVVVTGNNDVQVWETNQDQSGNLNWSELQIFQNQTDFEVADFNNDSFEDIITNDTLYFYNDGSGQFDNSGLSFNNLLGGPQTSVDIGDMDGDGDIDAFLGDGSGLYTLMNNDGSGVFSNSGVVIGSSGGTKKITIGDIDGDNDLDVFLTNRGAGVPLPDSIAYNTSPLSISTNAGLELNLGDSVAISSSELNTSDIDTPFEDRVFTLDALPQFGELQLSGSTLEAGSSFTQQDLEAGLVFYVNDSTLNFTDSFEFTVSDGFTVLTNQIFDITIFAPPVLLNNAPATVDEGGNVEITNGELQFTDADNTAGQLTYEVWTPPNNGQVELSTDPGTPATSWTQADINNGSLFYFHDGGETTSDSVRFTVTDGINTSDTLYFNLNITPVNDTTTLTTNAGAVLLEGDTAIIDNTLLLAEDVDNTSDQLIFNITQQPQFGEVEISLDPGVAITSFTQEEIDLGYLRYIHDGSENFSDTLKFELTDGDISLSEENFLISVTAVNDNPPVIDPAGPFSIDEIAPPGTPVGTPVTFTDVDTAPVVTHTYDIVEAGVPFAIDNAGQISTSGVLDFNTQSVYNLTVTVNDEVNTSAGETVTINLIKNQLAPDSTTLVSIYENNGGANWTNTTGWLTDEVADWFGVTVTNNAVTALDLSGNGLTGSFDISGGLDSLQTLDISGNELMAVEGIETKPVLATVDISSNQLFFDDLTDVITGSYTLNYSLQHPDGALQPIDTLLEIGSSYAVTRNVPGAVNYSWTSDGSPISETGSSFNVDITGFSDEAEYIASATNPAFPDLTITTTPVNIKVSSLERDAASLRLVYQALGVSEPAQDTPVEDFPGVTLDSEGTRVEALELPDQELSGSIPIDIADVANLKLVDFSNNNITGLPDFDSNDLPQDTAFIVTGNKLDFEDLLPNADFGPLVAESMKPFFEVTEDTIKVERGGNQLLDYSGFVAPTNGNSYNWKFVDVDPETDDQTIETSDASYEIVDINYENMGTYSLEVTNDSEPKFSDLTLNSDPQVVLATTSVTLNPFYQDSQNNDLAIPDGEAQGELYRVVESGPFVPQEDTITVSGGSIIFENIVLGDYVALIRPIDTVFTNENNEEVKLLPTYFESTIDWVEAETIFLRDPFTTDISMEKQPDPSEEGDGQLAMLVESDFAEEGDEGSRIEARRKVRKAGCSLRRRIGSGGGGRIDQDDNFELIAYKETDAEGNVNFGKLPAGEYRINIQYPGVPMDESSQIEFVIEPGEEGANFEAAATITEEGISVEIKKVLGLLRKYFKDLVVYPNPADDHFTLKYNNLHAENVRMKMVSLKGSTIKNLDIQKGFDQSIEVNTTDLEEGIYLLYFYDGENTDQPILTYKVVVYH